MNKANVFLLVVVSSLLTYISTATQPAATAAVAQEKWEYYSGQEVFDRTPGFPVSRKMIFPVGRYEWSPETFEAFLNGAEPYVSNRSESQKLQTSNDEGVWMARLWKLSGESGWHVFQVDPRKEEFTNGELTYYLKEYHWRRRVQ